MKRYIVWVTDAKTRATSPVDNIEAPEEYTVADYIADCQRNADDDWNEMLLKAMWIELEEVEA